MDETNEIVTSDKNLRSRFEINKSTLKDVRKGNSVLRLASVIERTNGHKEDMYAEASFNANGELVVDSPYVARTEIIKRPKKTSNVVYIYWKDPLNDNK
jgi:hypothetical protein